MKRNLQNVRFIIFAVAAVLAIQPVFAQTPTNVIVVTENSSTSLTATYSAGSVTVTPLNPDFWFLTFPSSVVFTGPSAAWFEPANSSLANNVSLSPGRHDFNVTSDATALSNSIPISDEGTIANVGTDSSNGGTISLTFDDDGDVATTVPDTGSTLGLLALALAALFGASRLRSIQLA